MEVSDAMMEAATETLSRHGFSNKSAIEAALTAALATRKEAKPVPIEDWETLQKVAQRGYNDALECVAIIELYQFGDQHDIFLKANSSAAAWAFKRISTALIDRLQMLIVRGYGVVARKDDRHLRSAIDYLNIGSNCRSDLAVDQSRLQISVDVFALALKDYRLKSLKKMRDKHIAHAALYEFGTTSPTYTDLFGFANVTISIWESLALGMGVASIPLSDNAEEAKASAAAYWELMTRNISIPYNRNLTTAPT